MKKRLRIFLAWAMLAPAAWLPALVAASPQAEPAVEASEAAENPAASSQGPSSVPAAEAEPTDAGATLADAGSAEAAPAPAEVEALDPTEDLYVRKCASCHTVGKGQRVGPDLKGVHEKRARPWLEQFIREPSSMLGRDPDARQLLIEYNNVKMPDLGLTAANASDMVDLLIRCSAEPCDLVGQFAPVATATADDVERGRALFVGLEEQESGGAPCLACHTVRGAKTAIPGGTLGKDLTHAFGRLGDEGLDAALKNPAFIVMSDVFADHPLGPEEVFALRAFLYETNRAVPLPEDQLSPLLAAGIGTLAVLAILNAAWARRLRGVRSTLTHRQPREELP